MVLGEYLGLEVVDVEDGGSGSGSKAAECFCGHRMGELRSVECDVESAQAGTFFGTVSNIAS